MAIFPLIGDLSLTTLLVGVVAFFLVSWILTVKKTRHMPPGPFQWPVFGNLPQLAICDPDKTLSYLQELSKSYGGIFTLRFGGRNAVLVSDVDLLKEALVKQGSIFSSRPNFYSIDNFWDSFHGVNAFFSNGDKWKRLRRFSVTALKDMSFGKTSQEDMIHEEADALLMKLGEVSGKPYNPRDLTFKAVSNIIASVVFGKRYDYDNNHFLSLINGITDMGASTNFLQLRDMIEFLQILPLNDDLKILKQGSEIVKFEVERQLHIHKESYNPEELRDVMDLCIKEWKSGTSKFLDRETMIQMTKELFQAGTETTATTLFWGWLFLAQHPEIQNKCHQEIQENFGQIRPRLAQKKLLPYCEATINEILRCSNITPLGLARMASADTTLGDYEIPKGTMLLPMFREVHNNDIVFREANEFRPERFLDEHGQFSMPSNVLAFSVGPRMCPGEPLARMELFIFFTSVLQRFRIKKLPQKDLDFSTKFGMICSPKNQEIILEPRI